MSTVSIKNIYLNKVPPDTRVAAKKELTEQHVANETEYRASIVSSIDDNEHPVTYILYTNPIFVSLPACRPTRENGIHEVHLRELPRFQNTWTVERLKDHTPDNFEDNEVMRRGRVQKYLHGRGVPRGGRMQLLGELAGRVLFALCGEQVRQG